MRTTRPIFLNLLDRQMRVIDLDLAWLQALADFNTRMADLGMAVGAPIRLNCRCRKSASRYISGKHQYLRRHCPCSLQSVMHS